MSAQGGKGDGSGTSLHIYRRGFLPYVEGLQDFQAMVVMSTIDDMSVVHQYFPSQLGVVSFQEMFFRGSSLEMACKSS